ncbi:flavin reductase family protein [Actinokineospora cianjurensis]|uniref:Flavin reductase (DIM6/NTAB) family NADH-FMN oxidoreductase RutF n=1 Tax=Actinokineospora cianjurensis TaxID=585224 RepID=A0A421AYN5_9PSEU|nr:flavin reductase family protein [Actinokineospora cianjurensis]RLK54982.1 flavin reductase (DIM6/NTAB) family NADH-FMN oxidoreductase RutF [Actinokineospora cianjurensis]
MTARTPQRDQDRARFDSTTFRRAMGRFTTGITVITTEWEGEVHGMTANGFLSVSLDPPLVLVSLDRKTRMRPLLAQSGRYGVSILADHQEVHSRHFAGRPVAALEPEFETVAGVPLLVGSLARIACRVVDVHEAGDHILHIGEVEHLDYQDGDPLVFYTGGYRVLHTTITEDFFSY